jgi:flagellar motor switch protein FliG
MQLEVTERIAMMDRTSPEIVKEGKTALEKKFASVMSVGLSEIGGRQAYGGNLNEGGPRHGEFILEELSRKEPGLAGKFRKRMFIFEDIATLDSVSGKDFCGKRTRRTFSSPSKAPTRYRRGVLCEYVLPHERDHERGSAVYAGRAFGRCGREAQQRLWAS